MIFKRIIIPTFLICNLFVFSQDFQGKAYYVSKTNPDMDSWGGRQMSEVQKKQIMERMRSMFEKTYILTFDKSASIYKEEEVLEAPGQGGFGMWGVVFLLGRSTKI